MGPSSSADAPITNNDNNDNDDNNDDNDDRRHRDSPTDLRSSSADAPIPNNVKVVTKDSFEELEIIRQQHVEALAKMIIPKLQKAEAKGAASKFIMRALTSLQGKLTLQEAESFQMVVKKEVRRRKQPDNEKKVQQRKKEYEQWTKSKGKTLGSNEVSDEEFFKDFM